MDGHPGRPGRLLAGAGSALLLASGLLARTITVDDDGPADFPSIQQAIDAAVAGDQVSVAPGLYAENIVLKSGVSVIGAGADRTMVDGGSRGTVASLPFCDASTRLRGFTLTHGLAPEGGGVLVRGGSPVVTFNQIVGNQAAALVAYYGYGGGIAVLDSGAQVSDNTISGNTADIGGGVEVDGGSPRVTRNLITGNNAGTGGGMYGYAGSGGAASISANTISSNTASYDGGGIEISGPGAPVISNNLIVGNVASGSVNLTGYGGGVDVVYSNALVINNTLVDNRAKYGGGAALFTNIESPGMVNNVLYRNTGSRDSGGADLDVGSALVQGNSFFLNSPNPCGGLSASLCNGATNLFSDPLLVNPAASDYRLRAGSPAIDSGVASGAPLDDLRGQRRPLDGNRDGVAAFDRGAYEYDRNDVLGLGVATPSALSWEAAIGASRYHVYSGALSTLPTRGVDTCRDADDPDPTDRTFSDPLTPPRGDGFAYLVTAVIAGAEQSPGFDSRGIERPLPFPCP